MQQFVAKQLNARYGKQMFIFLALSGLLTISYEWKKYIRILPYFTSKKYMAVFC